MSKILRTHQLSAEIINLIDNANQYCYLVTPYYKPWELLNRSLELAAQAKKKIYFILRNELKVNNIASMLSRQYKCEVRILDYLHTKLYVSDKQAIISSMNLYDTSNSRNLEMGYLIESKPEVQKIKKEIIIDELLKVKPVCLYKGWFYEEELEKKKTAELVKESILSAGYCVCCGKKMNYDSASNIMFPKIVRCYDCWANNINAEEWEYEISYCHYCGKKHKARLAEPLHKECKEKLGLMI